MIKYIMNINMYTQLLMFAGCVLAVYNTSMIVVDSRRIRITNQACNIWLAREKVYETCTHVLA